MREIPPLSVDQLVSKFPPAGPISERPLRKGAGFDWSTSFVQRSSLIAGLPHAVGTDKVSHVSEKLLVVIVRLLVLAALQCAWQFQRYGA